MMVVPVKHFSYSRNDPLVGNDWEYKHQCSCDVVSNIKFIYSNADVTFPYQALIADDVIHCRVLPFRTQIYIDWFMITSWLHLQTIRLKLKNKWEKSWSESGTAYWSHALVQFRTMAQVLLEMAFVIFELLLCTMNSNKDHPDQRCQQEYKQQPDNNHHISSHLGLVACLLECLNTFDMSSSNEQRPKKRKEEGCSNHKRSEEPSKKATPDARPQDWSKRQEREYEGKKEPCIGDFQQVEVGISVLDKIIWYQAITEIVRRGVWVGRLLIRAVDGSIAIGGADGIQCPSGLCWCGHTWEVEFVEEFQVVGSTTE